MNKLNELAKSAKRVQDTLIGKGYDCKVIELSEVAKTAQDAASAIGCDVAQIVKSLIFKTETTNRPVLVLASGSNRVNEGLISSYVGEKIVRAPADFVRDIAGFAIGGIPPVGHKEVIELIFIDQNLLGFESVWAAAGTPHAVCKMTAKELPQMTGGKVVAIL